MPKKTAPAPLMTLAYVPLADILAMPGNPKTHDLDAIKDSLREFGFNDPLAIDERTGHVVEGHGRTLALEAMHEAEEPPPARIQVRSDGTWAVPVVRGVAFEDDVQAHAYLLFHNKAPELGGWDSTALRDMLTPLVESGSLGLSGFEIADYEALGALPAPDLSALDDITAGYISPSSEAAPPEQPQGPPTPPVPEPAAPPMPEEEERTAERDENYVPPEDDGPPPPVSTTYVRTLVVLNRAAYENVTRAKMLLEEAGERFSLDADTAMGQVLDTLAMHYLAAELPRTEGEA